MFKDSSAGMRLVWLRMLTKKKLRPTIAQTLLIKKVSYRVIANSLCKSST